MPHHLIDIRDPLQAYSAAEFVRDATPSSPTSPRGQAALLVGGTMLYFKALLDGIDDMPAADPPFAPPSTPKQPWHGWSALHAELARVDPPPPAWPRPTASASSALEVYRISGQPFIGLSRPRKTPSKLIASHSGLTGLDTLISLEPTDRAWLHQRIYRTATPCWPKAWWPRCRACAHAVTCARPAVHALRGLPPGGKRWMRRAAQGPTARWTCARCANAASPPPAIGQAPKSPGYAACPSAAPSPPIRRCAGAEVLAVVKG